MENTNPGWGSPQPPKPISTGEGEVPLAPPIGVPPQPKVEVRTMNSDLRSMQERGGGEPRPYVPKPITPPPMGGTGSGTPAPSFSKPSAPFTPPRTGFNPPIGVPPKPAATPASPAPLSAMAPESVPSKKSAKGILVGVITLVVIVGLAAVGYFFIYPMFSGTPTSEEPLAAMPEPFPPVVPPVEEPILPPVTETPPPAEVTPPPAPPEIIPGIESHTSLFTVAPDESADVTIAPMNVEGLRTALSAGATAPAPSLKEKMIRTAEGKVVVFGEFAKRLVPGFFTPEVLASFSDDATYFTYTAANGTWFGIAVALKSGANLGTAQGAMNALQRDADNKNLFLADPGAADAWRDGKIEGRPASLADFATPGATLGYTWLGRTLLITTNLAAGEEAARRLGF